MRILVVEDEKRMAELLRQGLTEEGHVVTTANDGDSGLEIAESWPFDLLILDVMLPGRTGFDIARGLRAKENRTPILMLTARDSSGDIVTGLNLGADDYLTKPFSWDVLFARVRALGRRGPIEQPIVIKAGGLTLNQGTREVHCRGRRIDLTRTEYAILEMLARNNGRVVTRTALIEGVWGADSEIESNTLDAFVRLLRAKIEEPGLKSLVRTVRGVGFSLSSEI